VAGPAPDAPGSTQKVNGDFGQFLSQAVNRVNGAQGEAEQLRRAFELGDPNADLARVMLAGAKAQVAFKGMVEVRNRMVAAYQEIMSMPV
jgi:flagellar hook-basal body complex protein FliE